MTFWDGEGDVLTLKTFFKPPFLHNSSTIQACFGGIQGTTCEPGSVCYIGDFVPLLRSIFEPQNCLKSDPKSAHFTDFPSPSDLVIFICIAMKNSC